MKIIIIILLLFSFSFCGEVFSYFNNSYLTYNYELKDNNDFKKIGDDTWANRTLKLKVLMDNTLYNIVAIFYNASAAYSNAMEDDVTARSTTYGDSTNTSIKVNEKLKYANYIPNADNETISVTYYDSYLLFSKSVYEFYKQKPSGWLANISKYQKYYSDNGVSSNFSFSALKDNKLLNQSMLQDQTKRTIFLVELTFKASNEFIENNFILEDYKGKRYLPIDVEKLNGVYLLKFDYIPTIDTPYIRLKTFILNQGGEGNLTWYFNNKKVSPSIVSTWSEIPLENERIEEGILNPPYLIDSNGYNWQVLIPSNDTFTPDNSNIVVELNKSRYSSNNIETISCSERTNTSLIFSTPHEKGDYTGCSFKIKYSKGNKTGRIYN